MLEVKIKKRLDSFMLDVEFAAAEGVFAILGASGSGKSMTLKCIAGIERPDKGRIVLDGRVLFDSAKKINLPPQKRRVGYLFQDYALFPHMTVRKNVMAGMGRRPDGEKVDAYLRQFRLEGLEERLPAQLSGGQRQRAAMARLIASEPELILLDEPFSALDSHLREELEREMREELRRAGKPALFVSHDRGEVYRLCQTVGAMRDGRMEAARPVREFFQTPGTQTAARLSGCKNISPVEVLDEHHVRALAWNRVFAVRAAIPLDTAYIGIRAHGFRKGALPECDNHLAVASAQVEEDMFEWSVCFTGPQGGEPMEWKVEKRDGEEGLDMPEMLSLDSGKIMLLRE